MLYLLKEDPGRTLREVAEMLGVSHQATKRWWKWYTEGGVAELLQQTVDRRHMSSNDLLLSLRDHINAGTFRSLEQVEAWLGTSPHQEHKKGGARRESGVAVEKVIEFMNSLPSTGDVVVWRDLFGAALCRLFDDIDRVSVSLNLNVDLISPEAYGDPAFSTVQVIQNSKSARVPMTSEAASGSHAERLMKNIRLQGFPLENYHPPIFYSYYYRESAYLGTMILWRERHRRPITRETVEMINSLHHFFSFLFTDVVVQVRHMEPANHLFVEALDRVAEEHDLSLQERRVLTFLLSGASHEMIASSMHIAVATVRTHIRAIYQRTGVHSVSELFAQYFVPRPTARTRK